MPSIDDFLVPIFHRLSSELRDAITESPLPGLAAGPQAATLAALLGQPAGLRISTSTGDEVPMPSLGQSALWLLAGDLDRSHAISQDDSSAEGSFWHAIMHRRESDYSNAAYWFRRVGSHAVLDELRRKYPLDYGDPAQFIDAVAAACETQDAERIAHLQRIQWSEWQLLFQDCLPA